MGPKKFMEGIEASRKAGIENSPEGEFEAFRKNWDEFWAKSGHSLGDVLISHLCVEHYLEMYLLAANPRLSGLDKVRLTFSQKLQLATATKGGILSGFSGGLTALNAVRNKFVHNIRADITDADLAPMLEWVTAWHENRSRAVPQGLGIVKAFAAFVSMFLHGAAMVERGRFKTTGT